MITDLTSSGVWKSLETHFLKLKNTSLRSLFNEDVTRGDRFCLQDLGIYFDYSKHHINTETLSLLFQLARERGLDNKIKAMFSGEKINITENRAVLHTALRAPKGSVICPPPESSARSRSVPGSSESCRS